MVSTIFPTQILQTSSATITTWLPLLTPWPSTAACSSLVYVGTGKDAGKIFGWDPLYQAVLDTGSPRCFADEMLSWWFEPSSVTISLGPTFNCPAAYSTVATSVHSAGVTQVFCCPTDYKLSTLIPSHSYGDYPNQCMSTLTSGDILEYQIPTGGIYQPTSLTVSETVLVHGEHINGWNIDDTIFASMIGASQASSNTALLTSTTTTSPFTNSVYTTTIGGLGGVLATKTLESTTAPFPPSALPPSSEPVPIPSTKPSSTSPAVAAGIGVAAVVVVSVVVVALSICIRRRKKNANTNVNINTEIGATENYSPPIPYEHPASELSVEPPPGEMDGGGNLTVDKKGFYAPQQDVHEM